MTAIAWVIAVCAAFALSQNIRAIFWPPERQPHGQRFGNFTLNKLLLVRQQMTFCHVVCD